MQEFDPQLLKQLYKPSQASHKGQNGKVLIIGGSHLFHAASLWSLQIASKIVDMVFYSSVDENNQIVHEAKKEFRNGIVVPRSHLDSYIDEAECVLIGPGLVRTENELKPTEDYDLKSLDELNEIEDEGIQTFYLTKHILKKYPHKKYVLDAGALQMMEPEWLLGLKETPILTPHKGEFETIKLKSQNSELKTATENSELKEQVSQMAKEFNCVVLLKGEMDIVCGPFDSTQGEIRCVRISGGNSGMTKGGTGDVLAGLVAALYAKNDAFLASCAASYINKKAGESLFQKVGIYFNASDLADEIPKVMKGSLVDYKS